MKRTEDNWDQTLDRELKALPNRRAPASLMPRVLAAIEARRRVPWYRRSWWQWPRSVRVLSMVLTPAVMFLVGYGLFLAWDAVTFQPVVSAASRLLGPFWSCLLSLANAFGLILRKAGSLTLICAGSLCLVMYLSCITLGTVVYRVAYNR